jgi:hypothetical protein
MPPMSSAQEASWHGLLDLYEAFPSGWTLIGGQMVHLHCAEREFEPRRPTPDADTVLDVVGRPAVLLEFTGVLVEELGFQSAGTSADDVQHRFIRGAASIDVLIPDGVGERAAIRKGFTGSRTIATPGGKQAIRRSETVEVNVGGRLGKVWRPNLAGALVSKAYAHSVPADGRKGRHRSDFATLAGMIGRLDLVDQDLSRNEEKRLREMVAAVRADPLAIEGPPVMLDGLMRIEQLLGQ